jgi:hypothetical protein
MEERSNSEEGLAEYEVLKAILNREHYLGRLQQVARTVGRKFKPEVANVLDFVRASGLDVIDLILNWREAKGDHDAAFMWNGVNYILKMPSDCDYLTEYLAIKRWMGFSLTRNPFCVPFPLEQGVGMFTRNLTADPQHISKGHVNTDGFVIGGMSRGALKRKYLSGSLKKPVDVAQEVCSDNNMVAIVNLSKTSKPTSPSITASFVLNSDMAKIRQAELVILREEEKFGILSKDPEGRLMPRLQALTRQAHVELKKDDHRPLTEASQTIVYAPHAISSDVGVSEPNWTPDIVGETGNVNKEKSSSLSANAKVNRFLEEVDDSVLPRHRGVGKVGGVLSAIQGRGVESRGRRPLRTNLSSDMEFKRHRQIRTLGDKLAQIAELRESIEAEKARLLRNQEGDGAEAVSGGNRTVLRPISRSSSAGFSVRKVEVVRSAVSNHTHSSSSSSGVRKEYNGVRNGNTGESGFVAADSCLLLSPGVGRSSGSASPLRGIRKRVVEDSVINSILEMKESAVNEIPRPISSKPSGAADPSRSFPKISFCDSPLNKTNLERQNSILVVNQKRTVELDDKLKRKNNELRQLDNAQIETHQKLNHFVRDEEKIVALKKTEKGQVDRQRSRDIERKRRLLAEREGRQLGPPPEDLLNVYDYYAIRVQSGIRGFLARRWIHWYIKVSLKACKVLQAAMRGWFGRIRVRKICREFTAARTIQRNFRGWSTRVRKLS